MGRKLLALVPSALPSCVNFERFHPDATESPFLSIVSWTYRPNANSRRSRQLALDKHKSQLLELQRLQPVEGSRSWFVGNTVMQDGGVVIVSPADALFVLLDAASGQRTRFSSVYDLLARDGNTWLLQLSTLRQEMIEILCDVKTVGGEEGVDNLFVKINENKVTSWLRAKVEKVAVVLATQKLKEKEKNSTVTQEDVTRHYREAIEIVGDYLSEEWVDVLCDNFSVKKEVKVTTLATPVPQDTFKRFDRRQASENGPKRLTPSNKSGAKKKSKLDNVDCSGMKSLTSFFGKK